ncbi:MAG: hypothetical protein IPJ77_19065 [Planctomycetes bacterium]|nr:hypothetical protein [Planctomycetota bacterium]
MLKHHTAIVLGAGASYPYGFSLGSELKDRIVENLRKDEWFRETLSASGHTKSEMDTLASRLDTSPQASIDAFLDRAREFVDLGRKCITLQIAAEERDVFRRQVRPVSKDRGPCWYGELFRSYGNKPEHFRPDRLLVVTFNYDRSLEWFFRTRLIADFGLKEQEARSIVSSLGIIHVHGWLGDLPFGEVPNAPQLTEVAKGIRIISDAESDEHPAFRNSRHFILGKAEVVAFLGFGFHADNVRRLRISNHYPPGTPGAMFNHERDLPLPKKRVLGTTIGMTPKQVDAAERMFEVEVKLSRDNRPLAEFARDDVLVPA